MFKRALIFIALAFVLFVIANFAQPEKAFSVSPNKVVQIVDNLGNIIGGVATASSAVANMTVQVVDGNGNIISAFLPTPSAAGNMIFDTGSGYVNLAPSGDIAPGGTLGAFTVSGINNIPLSGTFSAATCGYTIVTDGSNHWIAKQQIIQTNFPVSGTPAASMIIPSGLAPAQTTFPNNFAATNANSFVTCGSNPSEADTWTLNDASAVVGKVCINTSCAATWCTGPSCSFNSSCVASGGSGSGFSESAGARMTATAPGTVSGANISIVLIGFPC